MKPTEKEQNINSIENTQRRIAELENDKKRLNSFIDLLFEMLEDHKIIQLTEHGLKVIKHLTRNH